MSSPFFFSRVYPGLKDTLRLLLLDAASILTYVARCLTPALPCSFFIRCLCFVVLDEFFSLVVEAPVLFECALSFLSIKTILIIRATPTCNWFASCIEKADAAWDITAKPTRDLSLLPVRSLVGVVSMESDSRNASWDRPPPTRDTVWSYLNPPGRRYGIQMCFNGVLMTVRTID